MSELNAAPVYFAPVTVVVVLPDWDIALAKAGGSRQPLTKLCTHLLSQIVQPPTSKHMAHITNSPTLCKKNISSLPFAYPHAERVTATFARTWHTLGAYEGCMLVHFWLFKLTFASRFLSWWLQLSYLSVVFVVLKTGPCGEFRIPANTELQHWVWCWLHCVAHIPAHLVISCTTKALNTNVYLKGQEKRSNGSWPMLLFGAVPVWHI